MLIEVQCKQKLLQIFFLPQETVAFGNNIEREPRKPDPKFYVII